MALGWVALESALSVVALLIAYAYLVRFERRVLARPRIGGGRSGWGPLWPLVDVLCALVKAPLATPPKKPGYRLAPLLTLIAQVLAIAMLPLGTNPTNPLAASLDFAHLDHGWLAAYLSQWAGVGGLLLWAHASGNAAIRYHIALQGRRDVAYGLAGLLALAGASVLTNTYDLHAIVEAQREGFPLVVYQPLGMALVAVSCITMGRRTPMASIDSRHETLVDFHVQHMGNPMALFHWADYTRLLFLGGLISTVYLGGWIGPWADGPHWLALKSLMVTMGLLLLRHRWLIPHAERIERIAWPILMWLGIANTLLTAALIAWRG